MTGGIAARVAWRSGRSRVVDLITRPPLAAKILDGEWGPELVLVGAAAGLLEGDTVTVDLALEAGASLVVRSTAATLAHPCPAGGTTSAVVRATLGAGARLAWLPEPLVACARCRHEGRSTVRLAPGAAAVWFEACTLGRTGERPGAVALRLDATASEEPLLRDALRLGPPMAGAPVAGVAASPAVLGGAAHTGSVHLLGRRPPHLPGIPVMALAGPGATVRAVAPDAQGLARALAPALAGFLAALTQPAASIPLPAIELPGPREDGEEKEALVHG